MSVSLDGFVEATDGDLSWSFPDQELRQHFNDREVLIDTYLYGRRPGLTYSSSKLERSAPELPCSGTAAWTSNEADPSCTGSIDKSQIGCTREWKYKFNQ